MSQKMSYYKHTIGDQLKHESKTMCAPKYITSDSRFSLNIMVFQHAPTNKLLYAKDIPKFKQEVKAYYKQVRDQPSITASEFKGFLLEESKVTTISVRNLKTSGTSERTGVNGSLFVVISETWKRVQRGCGPQRALQIHPAIFHRGQFFPSSDKLPVSFQCWLHSFAGFKICHVWNTLF